MIGPPFKPETIVDLQNNITEQASEARNAKRRILKSFDFSVEQLAIISYALGQLTAEAAGFVDVTTRGLAFDDPRSHPAGIRMICRRLDQTDKRLDALEKAREAEVVERREHEERRGT